MANDVIKNNENTVDNTANEAVQNKINATIAGEIKVKVHQVAAVDD